MHHDRRGIAITTASAAALPPLDAAVASFLSHRRDTPEHIEAALTADPDLAVAHIFAGFLALLFGRAELFPEARQALQRAEAAIAERGATAREQSLAEVLGAWCDGEMELAADQLDAILAAQPFDALTAKLTQSLRFMLGDAKGMRRSIETILPAWSDPIPGFGFLLGCHAFALEETDELGVAEQIGRRALEQEAGDVWGCHAVAHVYETRGATAQGIAWLTMHAGRWDAVNNFARHMEWHRALFHLARSEADIALALYDHRIRDARTDDYRDIANAASLLYRLEARGVAVGRRWNELADLAAQRLDDHALAFAQLHYLLCLIGDGRWGVAYRLFAAMDLEARCGVGTQARLLAEIGVPMAKTMLASFGAGPEPQSLCAGTPPRDWARLGGSHVQRQLFARILHDAETRLRPSSEMRPADPARGKHPTRLIAAPVGLTALAAR